MDTVALVILRRPLLHRVVQELVTVDVFEPLFGILFNVQRYVCLVVHEVGLVEGCNLGQFIDGLPLVLSDPRDQLGSPLGSLLVLFELLSELLLVFRVVLEVLDMEDLVLLLQSAFDEKFNLAFVDFKLDFKLLVR